MFGKQFIVSIFLGGIPFFIILGFNDTKVLLLYVKSLRALDEVIYYWVSMIVIYLFLWFIYRWANIYSSARKSFLNTSIEIVSETAMGFMGMLKAFSGMAISYVLLVLFVEQGDVDIRKILSISLIIFLFVLFVSVLSIEYIKLEDKRNNVVRKKNEFTN